MVLLLKHSGGSLTNELTQTQYLFPDHGWNPCIQDLNTNCCTQMRQLFFLWNVCKFENKIGRFHDFLK